MNWVTARVHDSYEFPADLPGDDAPGALRWTAATIALAAALLALTNAQSIRGWTEELPPGPAMVRLVAAANAWEDATVAAGLATGQVRLRKVWKGLQSARWSGEPVVEQADASEAVNSERFD